MEETAQTELEIAEKRLENAKIEVRRLKQVLAQTRQEIADKEELCSQLQKDAQEAIDNLQSLQERDTILQDRHHAASNRLTVAKDTPYETQEIEAINIIAKEIETNKTECVQAFKRQDDTKKALLQLKKLNKEIATLQSDLEEQTHLYDGMRQLHQEIHNEVGNYRTHALRDVIEGKETNVKQAEILLEQARHELLAERKHIEVTLHEWPEKAALLCATHGQIPEPESPTKKLLLAWLAFIEVLRSNPIPALVELENGQQAKIYELLPISAQDFGYFSYADNWRQRLEYDRRGNPAYFWSNLRVDVVRGALKRYK